MRIKYIELYNYQRLKSKGINRIKWNIDEIIQVIIGPNGYGKSSLMRELSPLPPDNSDYIKGGTKHVILEHKGQTYEMLSLAGSPSRHSFKCGDVELNASKNLSAQKELCELHFGYTNEIHELLLGTVNGISFTTMSPAKRREWLMALYPNDLTYVTSLHDRFKTMLRDAKGGIRTSSTHLSGLYDQRGAGVSVDEMQQRIDTLQLRRDKIARLVSEQISTENHQNNIDRTFVDLKTLVNHHRNPIALSRDYRDREHIVDLINQAQADLQQLEYAHQTHTKELNELANNEVFKQAATAEDKERLEQQQTELNQQIAQDEARWQQANDYYQAEPLWSKLTGLDEFTQRNLVNIASELLSVLASMTSMDNREVTIRQYDSVMKLKYELGPQIERQTDIVTRIQHKLKHLDSADRTECPECHHRWLPGVNQQQIEDLRQRGATEQATLDSLTERFNKCEQYVTTNSIWYTGAVNYSRFMAGHSALESLNEWLLEMDVLYTKGKELAGMLPGMLEVLPVNHRLNANKAALDQLASRLKMFDSDAVEWHKRRYQEHEDALNLVIEKQRGVKLDLAQLRQDLNTAEDAERMVAKIAGHKGYIRQQATALAEQTLTRIANTEHQVLGEEQRGLTTQLYNVRSLEGTITSTEQHVEMMKQQEEVLKLLVKATSPIEGVVAEQLSEFIACFIGNINVVIDELWDEVLQIRPCNIEEGSLSFKFPLLSGEYQCETNDISESSTGESQVINWVFRLILMEYLGFEDYPLYGDEIGANFDERHRPKLMEFLKKCASSGKYSQIFLISHYIAQHGVLTHAQVCALSTDGVALPERYNEHVEMS
jgi:energy-coupling factor transporter ATP-binding protein EcfA2